MKTVWISDTHNKTNIEIPKGDILIHCGDFTMGGTEREIIAFNNWMGSLEFDHKLVIAGNHDWLFQTQPEKARSLCTNFTYLEDDFVIINGYKIYGSPWQPTFFNWAFNLDRGEAIKEKWELIPKDTNILVTHGPSFGHLDQIPNGMRVGCEELESAIGNLDNLIIHGAGHIHHSYGIRAFQDEWHQMIRLNASICNERYEPLNKPIEVEL